MERVMGIEPTYSAWKAEVLPLNYTRAAQNAPEPAPGCRPHRPAPILSGGGGRIRTSEGGAVRFTV